MPYDKITRLHQRLWHRPLMMVKSHMQWTSNNPQIPCPFVFGASKGELLDLKVHHHSKTKQTPPLQFKLLYKFFALPKSKIIHGPFTYWLEVANNQVTIKCELTYTFSIFNIYLFYSSTCIHNTSKLLNASAAKLKRNSLKSPNGTPHAACDAIHRFAGVAIPQWEWTLGYIQPTRDFIPATEAPT